MDALPEDTALAPTRLTDEASEITPVLEEGLKQGLNMVKSIKENLAKLELKSRMRQEVWDREIASLEGQGSPRTLIAVCGATGAGKSSILNAILDDNIVPTSGMRACTAVVTELAYHEKATIDADISFLSEIEWRQELGVLLHDLVDEEGNIKRITDLKSDAGVAWQKVHAVYPRIDQDRLIKMSVNEIMGYDTQISRILGTTKTIVAKDSKTFAQEIGKYIDSKDQKRGSKKDQTEKPKEPSLMDKIRNASISQTAPKQVKKADVNDSALWPLIRQVNVRCRAKALSTGAVLVDLPGVADANAARNNIAKDYMKKCNCIWILAPITRAVDDKTARDLLGDAFKLQLMSDYDDHAITFIASKCDDISCSEVIRALRLEDDPQLEDIEERLTLMRKESFQCKKKKNAAEVLVKEIEAELEFSREQLQEHELHLEALENGEPFVPTLKKRNSKANSKKRKNSGQGKAGSSKRRKNHASDDDDDFGESDDDDSDKGSDEEDEEMKDSDADHETSENEDEEMIEMTEEVLKEKIKEDKATIKTFREHLNHARSTKKEAIDALSSVEKSSAKVQREKNAFCSLKRSEFSRDVLKEDFRVGLKDLDDAAAEERDPDNFNPGSNLRDYDAIDLPVFTCSSRDYIRLQGQVKGDGKPTCFSNIKDTGIPDLQEWCHTLSVASRERAVRTFMSHLKAFAKSIHSYVQGIGDVTATDREALREKWESQGFDEPDEYDINPLEDPYDAILGRLGADLGAGLHRMNKPAPKVDPYGQPTGIAPRLCTEFAKMVDGCVRDLQQHFKDGLEDKCRVGAENAAEAAIPTVEEFAASMHWGTYRATLRRHGSWRRDLNVELINPFTRNIAHSWSKVFESDLFAPFKVSTLATIDSLVKEVEESAAVGLKERARVQGEQCLEEARVALNKAVEVVKATMNTEQKEVSRVMAPHVQAHLIEGYDTAMEERGTGSVARQKAYFRGYIENCKNDIFGDGADVVMERLTKATEAIGEALDEAMGELAQKIEVSLAVLWEGARDTPAQLRARKEVIEVVEAVQKQIDSWAKSDKIKQEAAKMTVKSMAMDED
ncbi:Dynamin family-domain-containing protein [Crassisporium funariophilum]|nr:Dynamin family-domain-containing protein [Crassisporium funariophilum]